MIMPMQPVALILRTAGTNCDLELAHAFELAGAQTTTRHLNELIENPAPLADCDLIGLPGGFSYGDDVAAGQIFAHQIRYKLLEPLLAAIDRGVPVIAPCNGFQVLVKLGVLPGADKDNRARCKQTASLAENSGGRFIDRWTGVQVDSSSSCIWTKGLDDFELPIAHGEGRFVVEPKTLGRLKNSGQIALRYAGENPNGSVDQIAGVCDPTGLVLGLMPHPERAVNLTNNPTWTRRPSTASQGATTGLQMFMNAVEYVKDNSTVVS